jgi:hypothetical protein
VITKEQALKLKRGDRLIHFGHIDHYTGKLSVCICTGKVQTWARRPNDFRISVKHTTTKEKFFVEDLRGLAKPGASWNHDSWSLLELHEVEVASMI